MRRFPPAPSSRALILDLVGEEPDRPALGEALRRCRPGEVLPAHEEGAELALVVLRDGRAFAVPDRCPHDGSRLSDGFLDGDVLVCARHGWQIDPCAGRCLRRPLS